MEPTFFQKHPLCKDLLSLASFIVAIILGTLFLNTFIYRSYNVVGSSMENTLHENDRVIGCGGYSRIEGTNEAFIHRLYVKASKKRMGIGSAILNTIEAGMRGNGITTARIHLGTPQEQWFESYSFYPKHGYTEYEPWYMMKEL